MHQAQSAPLVGAALGGGAAHAGSIAAALAIRLPPGAGPALGAEIAASPLLGAGAVYASAILPPG